MVVIKGYAVPGGEEMVPEFKLKPHACFIKHNVIARGKKGGFNGKKVGQERLALRNDTDGIFKMA